MLIHFRLAWQKPGANLSKAFKKPGSFQLLQDYADRLGKIGIPVKISAFDPAANPARQGIKRWVCDRGKNSVMCESELIAKKICTLENSGIKELEILIGGADGFSEDALTNLRPDFRWCFGPLTLPHELAVVVSAEQIYRAYCILNHHPYHCGH